MMETELWKAIAGYEGVYEVSDLGRVRSLPRIGVGRWGRHTRYSGCMLVPRRTNGYATVILYWNGASQTQKIATLVIAAFIGPRPPGMDVCHRDGDRSNDRLDNLRYGTRKSNMADCVFHGTRLRGEQHPFALLSEDQVRQIRAIGSRLSVKKISELFGIPKHHVNSIQRGRCWKHLDDGTLRLPAGSLSSVAWG